MTTHVITEVLFKGFEPHTAGVQEIHVKGEVVQIGRNSRPRHVCKTNATTPTIIIVIIIIVNIIGIISIVVIVFIIVTIYDNYVLLSS